jgi:ABC-type dipeptide/oligopeptide/nickel transport system permease component
VAYRHALPAVVPPTITLAGAYTPLLVGNALLVEQVFNIPGVFRYTPGAVSNGVLGNLAADLVLARIDPRVRAQ